MKTGYCVAAASLAAAIILPSLSVAADASFGGLGQARTDQSAIDDITAAQVALSHGRVRAALTDTGNAETVLLNARYTGFLLNPQTRSINQLAWADTDEQNGHYPAAAAALTRAVNELR